MAKAKMKKKVVDSKKEEMMEKKGKAKAKVKKAKKGKY